jgi:hypothetical protein
MARECLVSVYGLRLLPSWIRRAGGVLLSWTREAAAVRSRDVMEHCGGRVRPVRPSSARPITSQHGNPPPRPRLSWPAIMASKTVIHAYRHLYRHGLRAVQFSKPARYTLRDRLRLAFRKGSHVDLEPQRIQNTVEFLQYATKENGLEHKIIKNILFVWWTQEKGGRGKPKARAP